MCGGSQLSVSNRNMAAHLFDFLPHPSHVPPPAWLPQALLTQLSWLYVYFREAHNWVQKRDLVSGGGACDFGPNATFRSWDQGSIASGWHPTVVMVTLSLYL